MDKSKINEYIVKFSDLLNDNGIPEMEVLDNPEIGDGFKQLGFEMDCGKMFEDKYGPKAFSDSEALERVIDGIEDVQLLGSAVFSKWRYYNHWAYGESIRADDSRKWFNVILGRIVELTRE